MNEIVNEAVQGLVALVSAFPQIETLAADTKTYFGALFSAKLISAEVQNALDAHLASVQRLFAVGVKPPVEFTVEPDPPAAAKP